MFEQDPTDWQALFFAHLASLLAPRSLVLYIFQQPSKVAPRPRLVALLTNGWAVDFRVSMRHNGFNLVTDQGLGLPKAMRRLLTPCRGFVAAPQIPTVAKPALEAARQCVGLLEALEPTSPVWLSPRGTPSVEEAAVEGWLDQAWCPVLTCGGGGEPNAPTKDSAIPDAPTRRRARKHR